MANVENAKEFINLEFENHYSKLIDECKSFEEIYAILSNMVEVLEDDINNHYRK